MTRFDKLRAGSAGSALSLPCATEQSEGVEWARKMASIGPVQVEVRVDRLVLHHERPILGVMVGVDDGEHPMVHVVLLAPPDVLELELYRLSVVRQLSRHPRPGPR